MRVVLKGPIFSQLDNEHDPFGACNVTSFAMCLHYLGMRGNGEGRFEDQLYRGMSAQGRDHGSPTDLSSYMGEVGARMRPKIHTVFHPNGDLDLIKKTIDEGYPCVVHGWFTQPGHIVAVFGYDDWNEQILLHDPYGAVVS